MTKMNTTLKMLSAYCLQATKNVLFTGLENRNHRLTDSIQNTTTEAVFDLSCLFCPFYSHCKHYFGLVLNTTHSTAVQYLMQ